MWYPPPSMNPEVPVRCQETTNTVEIPIHSFEGKDAAFGRPANAEASTCPGTEYWLP